MPVVPHHVARVLLGLALAASAACGGGDDAASTAAPDPTPPTGGTAQPPLFGAQTMVFGEGGRFTYVALLPSLDVRETIRLSSAREFSEYAPTDPVDGALVVADGEQPKLTRYTISESLAWSQQQTVDFSQFTSSPVAASVYVAPDRAYVPFDGTNHIRWNPTTFTITGEVGAPAGIPLVREGMTVARGNNHAVRGATLFQPYYWSTPDYTKYTQLSQIGVIDTATDMLEAPIDVPCPHLHLTTEDDQGNWYFSNGQGSIAPAVVNPNHPRNCFARIDAGSNTLDASSVVEFRRLTGGREGSNLFYIGSGRALFNVYHAERDSFGPTPGHEQVDFSSNYHLWTVDLRTLEASMMEGVDFAGGQFITFRLEGRTFVAIPAPDYKATAVYEVSSEGRAEKRFDVEGWMTKLFRIR